MFAARIDLFKKDWLDVIFSSKNKKYGAYELRNTNGATTFRAFLIASILFIGAFFAPKIHALIVGTKTEVPVLKQTEVITIAPPVEKEVIVIPPTIEPAKPKTATVKFAPPVVVVDNKVRNEEPPKIAELAVADPGQKTIEADPLADIVIAVPAGEGVKESTGSVVTENNTIHDFVSLEVLPSYPGGMDAFRRFLGNNIKYPPLALENSTQGTVYVSFTVEKDGRLTDVSVDRKIGGGLDEEAIRVVKLGKKWTPGIQNGQPVRVKYNVPVKFALL